MDEDHGKMDGKWMNMWYDSWQFSMVLPAASIFSMLIIMFPSTCLVQPLIIHHSLGYPNSSVRYGFVMYHLVMTNSNSHGKIHHAINR